MYVVFYSTGTSVNLGLKDHYEIVDNDIEALNRLEALQNQDDVLMAGTAKITKATEPHWVEI